MFVDTDTKEVDDNFDPHFKIFHDLMQFKVEKILLISSLYDAFIMEEDGSIATRLINEYQGLNLSKPPKITRVSSASEAFQLISQKRFDMVITMPFLGGMDAFSLGSTIKKIQPDLPVILVSHNANLTFPDKADTPGIDNIFIWCCEADLLLAIIKNVEDHRNVTMDTRRAMVPVIIYVEDSPLYRSFTLPHIYNEVVRQTQSVLEESLNQRHRLLRMRARPKILMAKNYEEAQQLFKTYKQYVFTVISDVTFRRAGQIDNLAGYDFLRSVREELPNVPMLMMSNEYENRSKAEEISAIFIDKNSTRLREELHRYFLKNLGFGDFTFLLPDQTIIGQASNLAEFEEQLQVIPEASLQYHSARDHFSVWAMARAEVALAHKLRNAVVSTGDALENIRMDLLETIHTLRKLRQKGVVVKFSADTYDPDIMDFVKIGKGSMGGKARGLAFMWACLQGIHREHSILETHEIFIPKTCVITTDGFDDFIAGNNLHLCKHMDDKLVADIFLNAPLPEWLREELRVFLQKTDHPLSVRSSSLLEDGLFKPYAGLYSTYFLANNSPDFEERYHQLESAVKLVYASTWFADPIAFSKVTGHGREDSMAVMIQQLVGEQYGKYFYPAVSGVAQSHNFYPVMGLNADEGIAHIALGIGKTVVEGGKTLWFSPAKPKKLIQFSTVESMLMHSQRDFYALDMDPDRGLQRDKSNLKQRNVQDAEEELPVKMLSSTYLVDEHRVRDACLPGIKIMTFALLLKYSDYPLSKILAELVETGKSGMGGEVEIEFAMHLHPEPEKSTFYFLQIRPMITGREMADVQISDEERAKAFCHVSRSLGHGSFSNMADIIFVHPESFDAAKTTEIADEIGAMNCQLLEANRPFLLIGPGRWGSADPWLGIPVQWKDISGVAAIIEIQDDAIRADPSQGTHFFQNITSLGIPYLTLLEQREFNDKSQVDFLDREWLGKQTLVEKREFVHHIRLENSFTLKCDGTKAESILFT